ncbi:hypothetical protein ACQB60_41275 [Actinomycetota bacterium Odt1-20B]
MTATPLRRPPHPHTRQPRATGAAHGTTRAHPRTARHPLGAAGPAGPADPAGASTDSQVSDARSTTA